MSSGSQSQGVRGRQMGPGAASALWKSALNFLWFHPGVEDVRRSLPLKPWQ